MDRKLIIFFALMLRDTVPVGVIEKLVLDAERMSEGCVEYECPHIQALAENYVRRLSCP